LKKKNNRARQGMDEFPKSMVIKFQINSNFYNNVIFKSNYVCGYFNHDKGQGKGCETKTKIDETAMEISCSAWVFGFLEIDNMSCSQAECVIAPQRHHAIGANSHIEDILT
jgi:hypothetical protein